MGGVDLIPTFLRYANLPAPWPLHGHDLTPLLKDPSADWSHPVLISQTNRLYGSDTSPLPSGEDAYHKRCPWYVSLTQGGYKYIRYLAAGEGEEFYDLESDPEELTNIATKLDCHPLVAKYRAGLKRELLRTEAPFADAMPSVKQVFAQ